MVQWARRVSWHGGGGSRNPGVWSENPNTWTLLLLVALCTLGTVLEVEEAMNLLIDWVPVPRGVNTQNVFVVSVI